MSGRALIGATGFVGGNLRAQAPFDAFFRSTDVDGIRGRAFDLLVCAGAPAAKWLANRDPDADRASLARLQAALAEVRAARFVLISTVDVFAAPLGADESAEPDATQPYGRHRRELEVFCARRFGAEIVRLPALYGPGLKKNAVYDLLHDNLVDQIHPDGAFQWYDVSRLWADLGTAAAAGLHLVHLAAEPVTMREVAREAFGRELGPSPDRPAPRYDFRSLHAGLWGGRGGYQFARAEVLAGLRAFVAAERARAAAPETGT